MTQQDPQQNRPSATPPPPPVQQPAGLQAGTGNSATHDQWYFITPQGREGPVDKASLDAMIRGRALHPETLVWRPGRDQWEAADLLPEFDTLMRSLPPDVYSIAGQITAEKNAKNVRINCIAMFVIFVISASIIALAALQDDSSSGAGMWVGLIVMMLLVTGPVALFAMIYVPVRWRQIHQQSRVTKTLGLIGAGGVIATLMITIFLAMVKGLSG